MSDLPEDLVTQFHKFVGACPATNLKHIHPADEKRLTAFFNAVNDAGFDVTADLIHQIWPESTISAFGGDPAQVPEFKSLVLDKAESWTNESGRGN